MTSRPQWLVRPARKSKNDRALLETFECAAPAVSWEVEVESHIRHDLFSWAFEPLAKKQDPRLLLIFERDSGELIGLAAHERASMARRGGRSFAATKLHVVAIARRWQGRRFSTGERVSDVVMSAVMVDVSRRVPPRDARVFAIVHEANERSVALCERHGLTQELSRDDPHQMYRRLITPE